MKIFNCQKTCIYEEVAVKNIGKDRRSALNTTNEFDWPRKNNDLRRENLEIDSKIKYNNGLYDLCSNEGRQCFELPISHPVTELFALSC